MPGSSVASGILAWPDSTSGRTAKRGRRIRTLVPQCRAGFRLAFLARAAGRLVSRSRFKSRSCLAATIQELVRFPAKGTAMIELTEEQRQEVRQANGEATRAIDPESKQEYVLIRAGCTSASRPFCMMIATGRQRSSWHCSPSQASVPGGTIRRWTSTTIMTRTTKNYARETRRHHSLARAGDIREAWQSPPGIGRLVGS